MLEGGGANLVSICVLPRRENWTCHDLDMILHKGDELYLAVSRELGPNAHAYLEFEELPQHLDFEGRLYNITKLDSISGLFETGTANEEEVERFLAMMETAFNVSPTNLIIIGEYALSFFKDQYGRFVVFDSHSRNIQGLPCSEGTSILSVFSNFVTACKYLLQLATHFTQNSNIGIELLPVTIEVQTINSETGMLHEHTTSFHCDVLVGNDASIRSNER